MRLNLQAPINQLGYGIASLNILKALDKLGHEVTLFPIGPIEVPSDAVELINKTIARQNYYLSYVPSLKIWHAWDMADSIGNGPRVGFPFFELDRLSLRESHHLRSLDKVIVASEWAKGICAKHNIKGDVVPLGVDRNIFNEKIEPNKSDTTVFMSIGKWEVRKGHDIIAKAFNQAFNETDNVALLMRCYNPFLSENDNIRWNNFYTKSKLGNKISVFNYRSTSQKTIAGDMARADCGLFPARGEGWNLELLEMMACGKKVIATNYSGHTAFVNSENCILLPVTEVEPAYDGVFFKNPDAGNWARLDETHVNLLSQAMLEVHRCKQERGAGAIFNAAGVSTSIALSWENTAKNIVEILSEL